MNVYEYLPVNYNLDSHSLQSEVSPQFLFLWFDKYFHIYLLKLRFHEFWW